MSAAQTVAVMACFRPDPAQLDKGLAALRGQVAKVVLVDDGSGEASRVALREVIARHAGQETGGLAIIPVYQSDNLGLGQAQNGGIAQALAQGARHILLLDQDSLPAPDMLPRLHEALSAAQAKGHRVALMAPRYTEAHRKARATQQTQPHRTSELFLPLPHAIASGALIPAAALQDIGPFDADLFIDLLDTEWCFRARAAGYECLLAPSAQMTHRIGAQHLRLGRYDRAIHAPFRSYYQIRNLLLIARKPHVPKPWVARQLAVTLARSLVLSVRHAPRGTRLRFALRGAWHGMTGRSGRLQK